VTRWMDSQPTEGQGAAAKTTGGAAALTNQWRHVLRERLPPEELKEYRLQESIRVMRHQHRQESTMSQEEFLEHRAKMAASKREQRRKRQKDDETPDEEAARKSYERDRKREQRRRKNESQTDCIALRNKLPQSEEEPYPRQKSNVFIVTSTKKNCWSTMPNSNWLHRHENNAGHDNEKMRHPMKKFL
jgi:hypothetical protein